jgi:GT2 family glycosyltransferase
VPPSIAPETEPNRRSLSGDSAAWTRMAAVVVTHHSAAVIADCLRALVPAGQLIIVDNASDDDTLAIAAREAPDARVIRNGVGVGYGNAVNQAIGVIDREFALLVNPDAIIHPGAAGRLVETADAWPEAALFTTTVFAPDGRIEPSHDVGVFDRRRYGSRVGEARPEGPCCVEYVSGAVMLARMAPLRALGGFDPSFFLYYEDDDLCLRLRRAGHSIIVVPDAHAAHHGGGSVRVSAHYYWEKFWHLAWSRLYLEAKHRGPVAGRRLAMKQSLGVAGKLVGSLVRLDPRKTWRDAARLGGTLGYLIGLRASRTPGASARPSP